MKKGRSSMVIDIDEYDSDDYYDSNNYMKNSNKNSNYSGNNYEDEYEGEYEGDIKYKDDNGNEISEEEACNQCIDYVLNVVGSETYSLDTIKDFAYDNYYDKNNTLEKLLESGTKLIKNNNTPKQTKPNKKQYQKTSTSSAEKMNIKEKTISKEHTQRMSSPSTSNPFRLIDKSYGDGDGNQGRFKQQYHLYHFNNPSKFDFSTLSPDDFIKAGNSVITVTKESENKEFTPIKKQAEKPIKNVPEIKTKFLEVLDSPVTTGSPKSPIGTPKRSKPKPTPAEDLAKERINIIIIGHVDAGKSTLTGRLLLDLGHIDKREFEKLKRQSSDEGKGSFAIAWILDENEEERNRGITIDVGIKHFDTEHKHVTILDAPGHRDFIPNMITGSAQADAAVLVIDSTRNGFEKGFESGGQIKEHILLVRSLGISQLCICVNKLDTQNWSEQRFNEIKIKLKHFLKQAQFKDEDVSFVPCSAINGINLINRSDEINWYKGASVVECIDNFIPHKQDLDRKFRMSIADVNKVQQVGITVSGRVQSGYVSVGEELVIMPQGHLCIVKSITRHKSQINTAYSGDNIDLNISGIEFDTLAKGQILCEPEDIPIYTNSFKAKIATFDLEPLQLPIMKGADVVLHILQSDVPAKITRFISIVDNNVEKKDRIRTLPSNSIVNVQIKTESKICLDTFENNKSFGRFLLRQQGYTVASGIVTSIKSKESI